jgi:FtsZ-binding cell division protein ZapB
VNNRTAEITSLYKGPVTSGAVDREDMISIHNDEFPGEPSSMKRKNSKHRKRRSIFAKLCKVNEDTHYSQSDFERDIKVIESPDFYAEICEVLTLFRNQRQSLEQASETIATIRSEIELIEEENYTLRQHITRVEATTGPTNNLRSAKVHRLPDPPLFSSQSTDDLTFED